jgi:hypothetical protein
MKLMRSFEHGVEAASRLEVTARGDFSRET